MLTNLNTPILIISAIVAAFFVAIWFSLILWTARDIKSRSRDLLLRILAVLAVIVLNLIGYVVYLILRPKYTIAEVFQQSLEEEALLHSLESVSRCPGCGRSVKMKWLHCPHCGTHLKTTCQSCHSPVELNWKICPFCGADVSEPGKSLKTDTTDNDSYETSLAMDNNTNPPLSEELIEDDNIEQL